MAVELSIIIPCYGHANLLSECLYALMSQQSNVKYEVIVVDSSPEDEAEQVISHFPRVRLIRSQRRLFPGGARNLGVSEAAGERLAFIDADCISSPRWIQQAMSELPAGCEIMGGPVLDAAPNHPIAWADNHLQFADFQTKRPAGKIAHVPSCNMILSKVKFDSLGGFRDDLLTGEDVLLTDRLQKDALGKIWFNPILAVRHHGRKTWRGFLAHQHDLGLSRGRLGLFLNESLIRTGRHPLLVWLMIPRRLIYIGLRTIQFDPLGILRFIFFLPLILSGLVAWTRGFHQGLSSNYSRERHSS